MNTLMQHIKVINGFINKTKSKVKRIPQGILQLNTHKSLEFGIENKKKAKLWIIQMKKCGAMIFCRAPY